MIEKRYCLTWMEGDNRGQRIELKEGRKSEYIERANEGMIFLTLSYRF